MIVPRSLSTEARHLYQFESYGVKVQITSNESAMIEQAAIVSRRSLMDQMRDITTTDPHHQFQVNRTKGGTYVLIQNGERIASGRSQKKFFKFFDSIIRVTIGEYAVDRVFMHAGAVGWNGKAIIMPGDSFKGKSTLVAELVRSGASYYSDDFAVFDGDGSLHPFPRPLGLRSQDGKFKTYEITPESLGGVRGIAPIPVGMILLAEYSPGKRWSPAMLTSGQGMLQMIPFTLSVRHQTDFSLQVLNKIASRAIIASSYRGSAEKFAKTFLNFVDKHVN